MDPNGSVIWKNETPDANSVAGMSSPRVTGPSASRPGTPNHTVERAEKSRRFVALVHLLNLIKKGSYAGTLIVMMVR